MKRRYRRYFVMLELEDKNFGAFAGEETKGYAKVEIRNDHGVLSTYCQNLKSSSDDNRYQWYLINTKADEAPIVAEIGSMEVNGRGKGETICEFNAENVKGTMEQMDNFDVLVLVARNKDEEDKLYIPLVGYMDKKKLDAGSWRYALSKYLHVPLGEKVTGEKTEQPYQFTKETAEEPIKETIVEVIEGVTREPVEEPAKEIGKTTGELTEEAAEEIVEGTEEKTEQEAKEDTVEEVVEVFTGEPTEKVTEEPTEETEKEIIGEIIEEAVEEIMKGIEKESEKEHEGETPVESEAEQEYNCPIEAEENKYEAQMQAYIENSLKGFLRIEPFVENLDDYSWWQIPYNTQTMYRAYMPFISYLDSLKDSIDYYAPKMLQIIYTHQHHIFGICYDENDKAEYYAYGILGRNLLSEQPFEPDKDLVFWHPCDNVPVNIESYGYWILTIDPKTGNVVKHK